MDKTKYTGTWLKFFKDAGIPTKTGASYAHIFFENRIHKDMLSDLTVDHLRLMGITLIGDIIAILRHAKSVHQDSLRKVVILKSKDDPPESSSSSSSSSRSNSTSSSSSSSDSNEDVQMVEITKPVRKLQTPLASKKYETIVKKETTPRTEEPRKIVRSKVINNTSSGNLSKSITGSEHNQSLKRKNFENEHTEREEFPCKKTATRTTNSSTNNGRSILKVPDAQVKTVRATTEKEFFGPKLPPPKKTVFDRLGAETSSPQVSSTTEVFRAELETKFTRTIGSVNMPTVEPVKIVANIDIPPPKPSSVFNRLGGLSSEPPSGQSLQYAGVLKSPQGVQRPVENVTKKIVTMRADEPEVPIRLRAATKPSIDKNFTLRVGETSFRAKLKPKLIKTDLGNKNFRNLASEGIFANPKNALHLSAKERLGLQGQKNAMNKSAKARLGLQRNRGKMLSTYQRIRQPIEAKQTYTYKNVFEKSSGGSKKVSFGGVDERLISPMQFAQGGRMMKSGIHSRLGTRRLT